MQQKNKGGRPSKAEMAARGITRTDLEIGLRILKKVYGPALDTMIEISDNADLPLKERFRMKQIIADMYTSLLRANESLKIQIAKGGDAPDEVEDKPLAPVFNFAK